MKIETGAHLVVRKGKRTVLDASPEALKDVALMSEHEHYPPSILKFLRKGSPKLRFIMLSTLTGQECTLANTDAGFAGAFDWLRANGWNVDVALERSLREPLVRSWADRLTQAAAPAVI